MMKKYFLLLVAMMLPLVASAHDIEVKNTDGVTIYYNYTNDGTELAVTFRGTSYDSYSNEYEGIVVVPKEVTFMNRTRQVTSIVSAAFAYCSGLISVTIPNGVTMIGNDAFYGCYGLSTVIIPNSVTSIGENTFCGCSGLRKVIVSDIAAWCGINFVGNNANPLGLAKHLYSDENTEIRDLVIPNSVTSIGNNAFYNCSGLTSVTIGNRVTSIGYSAFQNCSGLTTVIIPNSVTNFGKEAFDGCSDLKKVIVSDIAAWCGVYFYGSSANPLYSAKHLYSDNNTEIENLVIPNSVTNIGSYAFDGCSGLTSVTIGNRVTSINKRAFYHCSGLISIAISNSVTSIGEGAFYGCSGLTTVTIPNSVTSIGDYAFRNCSDLTSITIPNNVTSIGKGAFRGCSGLTSVTIPNSVTSIGSQAFDEADIPTVISLIENPFNIMGKTSETRTFSLNTFNNATLYVPTGTIDKYKAMSGWRDFWFIEEGIPSGIKCILLDNDKDYPVYDINGRRLEAPQRGINIINGKKVIMK